MATNLAIDDRLIEEAKNIGRHRTKKAAVTEALQEYIQRRRQSEILKIFNTIEYDHDYDYSLRVLSLGLFATYKYDINKNLYIRPRFGPMFMSYSFGGDYDYDYYDGYYSRGNVAIGIGVGYKLAKHLDLVSDFLVNTASYRRISVGLQFKF